MADIDKLEAIARAATPGAWTARVHSEPQWAVCAAGRKFHFIATTSQGNDGANAAHIAAFSPERVLALLAVVRAASKVSAMSEDGGDSLVGEAFSLWFAQWQSAWATLRTALAALDALEENGK